MVTAKELPAAPAVSLYKGQHGAWEMVWYVDMNSTPRTHTLRGGGTHAYISVQGSRQDRDGKIPEEHDQPV